MLVSGIGPLGGTAAPGVRPGAVCFSAGGGRGLRGADRGRRSARHVRHPALGEVMTPYFKGYHLGWEITRPGRIRAGPNRCYEPDGSPGSPLNTGRSPAGTDRRAAA